MTNDLVQLSCQELVELVTHYLEGVLPEAERVRFEEHVTPCSGCREYLEQMRTTIALAGRLQPASLSPEAEEVLLRAFRGWRD